MEGGMGRRKGMERAGETNQTGEWRKDDAEEQNSESNTDKQ